MNTLMKRNSSNGSMPTTSFSGMVDSIFQNNLKRFFDDDFWGGERLDRKVNVPVNVKQTDKSYELEVIAPGLKKEDFKISLNGDMLTISFEHQEANSEQSENEHWVHKEYRLRSFSRTFNLDDTIDVNKVTAKYNDGILQLNLPIKEDAKPFSRTIEIR